MISNSEYTNLLNKYNRLVAENEGLKDQLKQHRLKMQEREKVIKREHDAIKSFCESVLAKDSSEMVVGSEYSWSKLPLIVLIEKAGESYKKYNSERNSLLMRISDMAEQRANEIESLKMQISQMQTMSAERGVSVTAEEAQKEIEAQKLKEDALKNTTQAVRDAEEKGTCEIIYTDDDDATNEAIHAAAEAMKINASVKITPASIPVCDSRQKIDNLRKEKERAEAASQVHVIDIEDIKKRLNDMMLEIMTVLGTQGISISSELQTAVEEDCQKKNIKFSQSRFRAGFQGLIQNGIFEQSEKFSTFARPTLRAVRYTVLGHRIYSEIFGKAPDMCEWDRVVKEHDNLVHGYGILETARAMEKSRIYKSVTCENHRKPIPLKNGTYYVPDIIGQKERTTDYIEFEHGNHTLPEFKAKLDKMIYVTKFLCFVSPNQEMLDLVINNIRIWAKEKTPAMLANLKVKLSTQTYFANHEPGSPGSWMYFWHLNTDEIIDNSQNETS